MHNLLVAKPNLESRTEINLEDVNDSKGTTREPHQAIPDPQVGQ